MARRLPRWTALGILALIPALFGAEGEGCNGRVPIGGDPDAGRQCKSDTDCPLLALCRLCPDGSCANPNVRCLDGTCSLPKYTCGSTDSGAAQCKSDADCPVDAICKPCADGSCASPNVHCVNGACSAPSYTCPSMDAGGGAQCKTDLDCPMLEICKPCPDGSCANPNIHCVNGACSPANYTCPSGTVCRSSQDCAPDEHCTVEDGVCNPPPGCTPGQACPAICYGTCAPKAACQAEQTALQELLAKYRSCTSDSECTTVAVSCLAGGFCGSQYVNQSIDRPMLDALSQRLNLCVNGNPDQGCPVCLALPPPPACVAGKCGAKPVSQ